MIQKFNDGWSTNLWNILTGDKTWICQYEPETKQRSTVWLFQSEDPPAKFKRTKSVGMQMVASFFGMGDHIAIIPLEDCCTVNADWYTGICLPKVFDSWCERLSGTSLRGLHMHHDNASAHMAAATFYFLAENGVRLVSHLSYSPGLAPCSRFLFPSVKPSCMGPTLTALKVPGWSLKGSSSTYLSKIGVRSSTSGSTGCTTAWRLREDT